MRVLLKRTRVPQLPPARAIGASWDEAHALAGLGRCAIATGSAEARDLLRQAHDMFRRIGAAKTRDVLAELHDLTRPGLAGRRNPVMEPSA
jgi:hypothetical protein